MYSQALTDKDPEAGILGTGPESPSVIGGLDTPLSHPQAALWAHPPGLLDPVLGAPFMDIGFIVAELWDVP